MMRVAAALIVGFVLAGQGSTASLDRQRAATSAISIPFEVATRHVIVKATVNGSRPLSFALDTGANRAIVRTDIAKELQLTLYGTIRTGGAGPGAQEGSFVRDATWSLVGLDGFAQPVAVALPFSDLPSALGRDLDGIIGAEFIRQFVVEIDYRARMLTLHDRDTFAYTGHGEALPLDFTSNGHPVLDGRVAPVERAPIAGRFLLDIGSGLALILHSPFVAEHGLLLSPAQSIRAIGISGAGGRSIGRFGRVVSLQIGSFKFDGPLALFSQDQGGAFANAALAGNIGATIASRFRMFLDYGRRRIILEPAATLTDPFDAAISGLALRAYGADHRTFRVHEVLEASPATDAGIAEGDVIMAIDGSVAATFTLSEIIDLFEKPVARELTMRREGRTFKTTLTPRHLI